MAENSQFFEAIVAQRALVDWKEGLEASTMLSLETQEELVDSDIVTFITDNFDKFLRLVHKLSKIDQELLFSYYLLKKTQTCLAIINRSTQTIESYRIRMAEQKLAALILFGGQPSREQMHKILKKAGLEDALLENSMQEDHIFSLSALIFAYAQTRNFQRVAEVYRVHRPEIRRSISRASKKLLLSKEPSELALGSYLYGLINKASASEQGLSKREKRKHGHLYRTDPMILDQFVISVDDPDFDDVMVSRANF